MNILLIGSGGREHALAWAIAASSLCDRLFIAPGNPGTAQCGTNVPLDPGDHAGIASFCREEHIDFVVVGPESPLVAGRFSRRSCAESPASPPPLSRASPMQQPPKPLCASAAHPSSSRPTALP